MEKEEQEQFLVLVYVVKRRHLQCPPNGLLVCWRNIIYIRNNAAHHHHKKVILSLKMPRLAFSHRPASAGATLPIEEEVKTVCTARRILRAARSLTRHWWSERWFRSTGISTNSTNLHSSSDIHKVIYKNGQVEDLVLVEHRLLNNTAQVDEDQWKKCSFTNVSIRNTLDLRFDTWTCCVHGAHVQAQVRSKRPRWNTGSSFVSTPAPYRNPYGWIVNFFRVPREA